MNYDRPDEGSVYADEGTAAHALLEWCLVNEKDARDFPHPVIHVLTDGGAWYEGMSNTSETSEPIRNSFECDDVMREHIQTVLDDIRRHAKGYPIIAEERVFFNRTLNVPEEFGSGSIDARVRDEAERTLQMHDLKYGASPRGIVYAGTPEKPNPQLGLYGVGALEEDELTAEYDYVDLHIHQPRLNHKDVVRVAVEQMRAFAQSAKARAHEALLGFYLNADGTLERTPEGKLIPRPIEDLDEMGMLVPSAKGCHYCAAAAACPALRRKNNATVIGAFEVLQDEEIDGEPVQPDMITEMFAKAYPSPADLELLETFVSSVRSTVWDKLKAGEKIQGWKLVKTRKGARAWVKAKLSHIEEVLKSKFRLKSDEMYSKKLITPTQAEAILKEKPKQWAQINTEEFITQSEGGETLAAADDKRKAIEHTTVRDSFEVLESDLV